MTAADTFAGNANVYPTFFAATGPVILRVPTLDDILTLANLTHDGLFADAADATISWYPADPTVRARQCAAYLLTAWTPEPVSDRLPFAVIADGTAVGLQALAVKPAPYTVGKTFETGSWLAPAARGRRIGTLARQTVLAVAFHVFNAETVTSSCLPDNVASAAVSTRCGYDPNGTVVTLMRGRRVTLNRFRLDRATYEAMDKPHTTVVDGQLLTAHLSPA